MFEIDFVAQLQLDLAQIAALVGQSVTTTVSELVRMNQRQPTLHPDATKHAAEPVNINGTALALENMARADRLFASKLPQQTHLILVEGLCNTADRALPTLHRQSRRAFPGDLRPAQRDQLADPQTMPVTHQNRQRVTLTISAALLGGRNQKIDLGRRQVLTLAAIFGVRSTANPLPLGGNCSQSVVVRGGAAISHTAPPRS